MRWLFFFIGWLAPLALAEPVDVNAINRAQVFNLNAFAKYLVEPLSQNSSPDSVRDRQWLPLDASKKRQSFGMEDSILWLRIHVSNSGPEAQTFYFVSEDHRATRWRYFVTRGLDVLRKGEYNSWTRLSEREFPASGFPLRLVLEAQSEQEIFIAIESTTPKEIELNLYTQEQLEKLSQRSLEIGLVYLGAMTVIVFYNFFLLLVLREKTYLYYVLFELACGLTLLAEFGLGYRILWPDSPWMAQVLSVSFPTLSTCLILLFTRAYFDLGQTHRRWNALYLFLSAFCLVLTLISLFSMSTQVILWLYVGVALACLAVFITTIYLVWRRSSSAFLFAIAWLPFMGLAFYNMISQITGDDISSFFLVKLMMASSLWEMIFLSLALGARYNRIQQKEVQYLLDIQRKEQLTREAVVKAEQERREKAKFADDALKAHLLVRVIAHDLVNPISIMSGHCRRIESNVKNPDSILRSVEKIEKALGHQLSIISHVRDLEAVQSGKQEISIGPVNLQRCFETLLDMYQDKLKEKNLSLQVQGLTEYIWVFGEENGLIFQVLSNFLSNAIKFSQPGSSIECQVQQTVESVSIVFTDHGMGMSEDLQERIFDSHEATSRLGTAGERGTGFGLPIAQSYIAKYGGDIRVNSREIETHPDNHGSEFTISLRRAEGPNAELDSPLQLKIQA